MKAPGLSPAKLKQVRKQEQARQKKLAAQRKKDYANGCTCMPYSGGCDVDCCCPIHGKCRMSYDR